MTDKEFSATALEKLAYYDMLAAGASEEFAQMAAGKVQAACKTGWDCAIKSVSKWLEDNACEYIETEPRGELVTFYRFRCSEMIEDMCKEMEG